MDAMEAPIEIDDAEEAVYDDGFVLDSLDMILSNYRGIVESRDGGFSSDSLDDVLKAFVLFLYGKDLRRVSMMQARAADDKLFEALSEKNVEIGTGFRSWKSASTVVQGLQMMSLHLQPAILMKSFINFSFKVSGIGHLNGYLQDYLILKDNVNEIILEMVHSDDILMPWYVLTTLDRLSEYGKVKVSGNVDNDLKRLTMLLLGARYADISESSSPIAKDAVFFLPPDRNVDYLKMLRDAMDSIPEGGTMVLVSLPGFCTGLRSEEARSYLNGFRIEKQYKVPNGVVDSIFPLLITKVVKAAPGGEIALFDLTNDDATGIFDQSQFDWNMERLLFEKDFMDIETIPLSEVADVRRGVIVSKADMAMRYDARKPVYLRPMDIIDGRFRKRSKLQTIARAGLPMLEAGSLLVSSLGVVSRSAIVTEEYLPCVAASYFYVVNTKGEYPVEYLLAFVRSSFFEKQAHISCGIHLTTSKLMEISVPVASKPQQEAIIKAVDELGDDSPEAIWNIFIEVIKS